MTKGSVAIIGTGIVGTRLAEEIISQSHASEVILINRDHTRLIGVFQSLESFAFAVGSSTAVRWGTLRDALNAELVVICVKDDYNPAELLKTAQLPLWLPRTVRTASLLKDLPIFTEILGALRGFSGTIAVISNPVEIVTSLTSKCLSPNRVIGLGSSLDTMRLALELSRASKCKFDQSECPVGGIHGVSLVPFKSCWSKSARKIEDETYSVALERCVRKGPQIVEALGYSVHDCAAVFANDIRRLLVRDSEDLMLGALDSGWGAVGGFVRFSEDGRLISANELLAPQEIEIIEARRAEIASLIENVVREPEIVTLLSESPRY